MKSRKTITRIVACILCMLSITALVPTVAFAADAPELDAVGGAVIGLTDGAKTTSNAVKANSTWTVYVGNSYYMQVPCSGYTVGGRSVSVRFQWQVKKGSGRSYTNVRGANCYRYVFKATRGKNGWKYRCKVTARYVNARSLYYVFPTLKVKSW